MSIHPFWQPYSCIIKHRLSASSGTNPLLQTNKKTNKQTNVITHSMTWNKCKCRHNNTKNTCKVMKTKTWKHEYKRKEQTNITDWVVWFRLLFQFIRCCLVIIKIADMWFISLLTVWFGLLQVCCKFVTSLLQVCCKFEYSNSNKRPHLQYKPS
jgi:hypothetical protein